MTTNSLGIGEATLKVALQQARTQRPKAAPQYPMVPKRKYPITCAACGHRAIVRDKAITCTYCGQSTDRDRCTYALQGLARMGFIHR